MHKSRQLVGLVVTHESDTPSFQSEMHYREYGEDNAFPDITQMTGDETEIGDTRFDNPGPDVEKEGPMPRMGNSALYTDGGPHSGY